MSELYKPVGAVSLDAPAYNYQLRVGIQGMPGSSKTWASTTFPNPVFVSFDRGLVSHIGRKDIIEIQFYNGQYVDSIVRRSGTAQPPNRKEALVKFLTTEALKLSPEQTLVLDANTGIQTSYHVWWEQNKMTFLTDGGKVDARKEWSLKLGFYRELFEYLKALSCSFIFIYHESPDRNDKGDLNGQVRPLLTGQFQDEVQSHFTDWYRSVTVEKPKDDAEKDRFKKKFGPDETLFKEWMKTGTADTLYLWQTQSDSICKCKTSLVAPKYILADYSSFQKYKRKISAVV